MSGKSEPVGPDSGSGGPPVPPLPVQAADGPQPPAGLSAPLPAEGAVPTTRPPAGHQDHAVPSRRPPPPEDRTIGDWWAGEPDAPLPLSHFALWLVLAAVLWALLIFVGYGVYRLWP